MLAAALAATVSSACLNFEPFGCTEDTQCDAQDLGRCELSVGYCSYPDVGCPVTLYRFEENAGMGLGGQCVPPAVAGTGTDTDGPSTDTEMPPDTDGTSADSTATGPGPTDGTDDATTGGSCGGAGDACCAGNTCDAGLVCNEGLCGCISAIGVGNRHSCAIKLDGSLWCWGDNTTGQLAVGAPKTSPDPLMIPGFGPGAAVQQVQARNHTCAVQEGDTLFCWGDNSNFQVDFGAVLEIITTPVQTVWADPAMQLGVGGTHTCVGRGPGFAPTCWGDNSSGQLTGMGSPGPQIVGGGFDPFQIALGDAHSCISTLTGELYCWGANAFGQLGVDPVTVPTSNVPQAVVIAPVGEIVAGAEHTCARAGEQVLCWGRNNQGQLGNGTNVDSFTPVAAMIPAGMGTVDHIVAAADHTCAVLATGALYCWGGNQNGELLLQPDKMGNDAFSLVPQEIMLDFAVEQLATGVTHTCALSTAGQMMCWGRNAQGQIGDGTLDNAGEPTAVQLDCP